MDSRRSRARRAGARLFLLLVVGLSLGTLTAAAVAAAPSGVRAGGWSAASAGRFWTPARMREAKPAEVSGPTAGALTPGAIAAGREGAGSTSAARATVVPPAPPKPVAPGADFVEVPDPTDPVSRVNGAIFFEAEGGLARCSGTAVDSPNLSVVFTAGHCVHDTAGARGGWYRGRWIFVPGYRYGQRPFGVFVAKWLDSTSRWVSEGNENFDVGAAVVGRNEKGQRLGAAVGGTGIAWSLPPKQSFDIHGYPVGRPFDGETQRLCPQTPFLGHDPESFLASGPLNLAVRCRVTGGASGGGWTIEGDRGEVLNGVTDYGYPEDPEADYGAYFGPEVARLYHRVARFK